MAALETGTLAWAHASVFSALLRLWIVSAVTPQVTIIEISQIWYQVTLLLHSGPSKTSSHFQSPTHCSETSSFHVSCSLPSDTLVFLLFLQPARSAPSLAPPASEPLPQVLHGGHLHVTQTPWGTSSSERQPVCHPYSLFVTSVPIRTGEPCPPAAHTRDLGSETSNWRHQQNVHLWPRCLATQPHFWC